MKKAISIIMNKKSKYLAVFISFLLLLSVASPIYTYAADAYYAEVQDQLQEKYDEIADKFGSDFADKWAESAGKILDEQAKMEKKAKIWIMISVPLTLSIAAFVIVKVHKSNKTAKKTFVPFQPIPTDNENHAPLTVLQKIDGKCMYCGKEIAVGSEYCNHCGKKQAQEYVKVFNKQNMNNDEFIASINRWLAENPKIANVSCEFNTRTGWGWLVNKYVLDSVALKYELFNNNNENQYALIELSKFGLYHKPAEELLDEWKAKNPQVTILKTSGGSHSRGKENHELFWGIGANNKTQLFVFFKFKR